MTVVDIHPSRLSLGVKVSVITGAQYRYEGTVAAINSIENTLTLQNVCFWGLENRTAENTGGQNGDKKPPAVGSIFNLITFWMSSIVQLWLSGEEKQKNDLGDKGIAEAGVPVDMNRSRGRRSRNWWQSGDQQRNPVNVNGSVNRIDDMNSMPVPVNRYPDTVSHSQLPSQPRMLVSYPRRGRNSTMYPRHTGFVPVVPVVPGPRRSAYGARSPSYRRMTTPIPPGPRLGGRRSGPPMRPMMGSGDEYHYNQSLLNPAGGVLVYLPPEMAAAYQSHGINFVPPRPNYGRRRMGDRRNTSRAPESTEPEIDCTTPYDFEAANAEFKEELAKITINPDGVPVTIGSQSGESDAPTGSSGSTTSTGDSQTITLRSPSSTISASGNGASGDSTRGAVTSNADEQGVVTTNTDGNGPLAKGEYYVREKCFFDQISRPESGPRTSFMGDNGRTGYGGRSGGQNRRPNYGSMSGMSYGASIAARRERQLNMETFGSMAARTTLLPRRRGPPSGHVPREYLVSAPA